MPWSPAEAEAGLSWRYAEVGLFWCYGILPRKTDMVSGRDRTLCFDAMESYRDGTIMASRRPTEVELFWCHGILPRWDDHGFTVSDRGRTVEVPWSPTETVLS